MEIGASLGANTGKARGEFITTKKQENKRVRASLGGKGDTFNNL